MKMTRWDPLDEIVQARETLRYLFDESLTWPGRFDFFHLDRSFPVDIFETSEAYEIDAALPGIDPSTLSVSVAGSTLTIRAHSRIDRREDSAGTYIRQERMTGALSRVITLPSDIDTERVRSVYDQGILVLFLPKKEVIKTREIPVQVGGTLESTAVSSERP